MEQGDLPAAASLVGTVAGQFADDRELMEALSNRLLRLLQARGRFSALPSRLRLEDSALPVPTVQARVGDLQGLLIWDSGSESSALDRAVCSQLGLRRIAGGEVRDSTGEVQGGSYVAVLPHSIGLGPAQVDVPVVFCIDLGHIVDLEPQFIGILGGNALGASSYQLNLARSELAVGPAVLPDLVQLDAEFRNGMPYVQANVDGNSVQFLLDTGADYSVLSTRTIEALGLVSRGVGESRTTYEGGGRREESGERIVFDELQSGSEARKSVEFRTGGTDLLGLDFIGARTLVVDRERGVVALSP